MRGGADEDVSETDRKNERRITMQNVITMRADLLYSLSWTAKKGSDGNPKQKEKDKFYGWCGKNEVPFEFEKGKMYHIPYGRPAAQGEYIGYGVSIPDFLEAANNVNSVFYQKRGKQEQKDNMIKTSTYYAMDCSTFVSLCWDLPERKKTTEWSELNVTDLGVCEPDKIKTIEPGDALNRAGHHIALVTRIENGIIEITEMTPPQMLRTYYTIDKSSPINNYQCFSESEFCKGTYTIYRYNNRGRIKPFSI